MNECNLCGSELKYNYPDGTEEGNVILGAFCSNEQCDNSFNNVITSIMKQVLSNGFITDFELTEG